MSIGKDAPTEFYDFPDDEDSRILEVAREYMLALERGEKVERESYLSRYPDLRIQLDEYLEGVELACSMASPKEPELDMHGAKPLGDFRIIREIGRGGMGVVYEAIQLSLGRRVALKVLPFAASLDDRHLQRFRVEAQAAAQLHHSNIVPVYAVGCERGIHFYAMQLIDGQPVSAVLSGNADTIYDTKENHLRNQPTVAQKIDTTATTQKSIREGGKSREKFRRIAMMIMQVADALEYAHSCGIVHRDVKPANLLLDTRGKVWVTDFGLAHVAANNQVTQTGDLLGTLRYMSPEQASGQRGIVDHRTDIYSLGVTLYELLVERPVFEAQDRQRLLNHILNDTPKPLRQIDKSIPIELETIVLKAIEPQPNDRYATAGAFGADLRRYLSDEPILARRPSLVDLTRKWMRRHPSVVASVVVVSMFCSAALAATTAIVAQKKSVAEKRLELAQQPLDEMIELADDELLDNPQEEGLRQRLLSIALTYYQRLIDEGSDDPRLQNDLQVTRDRVQKILADLALVQANRTTVLLSSADVRKDIGLTEEQVSAVSEFIEMHDKTRQFWDKHAPPHFPGQPDPPFGEHSGERFGYEQILEAAKKNDERLSKILSLEQRKRLKQIGLQALKEKAFRNLTVADELGLSNEQKSAMSKIIREYSKFSSGFRGGPGDHFGEPPFHPSNPFDGRPANRQDDDLMNELTALLNFDQLNTWQEMTGPKFNGDLPKFEFFFEKPFGMPRGGEPRH